ncbi:unnamed protein product [Diabrotica balteata]|uniref:Teneurin-1-4-like galactose-binding domain-containing protein n=1 Tax=Diabrotica balteata TaxID=107213 RepID=A0A9N9T6S0_DIABA|nr:unnamed protein product [Diabrotica balteata]
MSYTMDNRCRPVQPNIRQAPPQLIAIQHQQPSQQQQQQQQQQQPQTQWPPLPLLEQTELDTLHSATIPPYQFWNSEFRNKQPAFINFNFTLPWGANFAVYGRRNVAPSVTQYDFVEFVNGGRVNHRLRRKRDVSGDFPDLPLVSELKLSYDYRTTHKSDVLDSISNSYEGTKKILADSEPRGPFYIPHSIKIDFERQLPNENSNRDSSTDLPHPTLDIGIEREELDHVISKREAEIEPMMVNVSLLHYLDTGRWFLSVYNDELQPHSVSLIISEAEGAEQLTVYDQNIQANNAACEEKKDRETHNNFLVFDLHNVLSCAHAEVSNLYYKIKLKVYNLTAILSKTKQVHCALWSESLMGRSGNDIASALIKILKAVFRDHANVKTIIF